VICVLIGVPISLWPFGWATLAYLATSHARAADDRGQIALD